MVTKNPIDFSEYMQSSDIKCRNGYVSKYCFINKKPVHINDYVANMDIKPVCLNNHELIAREDDFIHKEVVNIDRKNICKKRDDILRHYPLTNVTKLSTNDSSIFDCDILLGSQYNSVIKICCENYFSPSHIEIIYLYYKTYSKDVIWLIRCNKSIILTNKGDGLYNIEFIKQQWKYQNFSKYDCIFLIFGKNEYIAKINPNDVKNNCIQTRDVFSKKEFIKATIYDKYVWDNKIMNNATINYNSLEINNILHSIPKTEIYDKYILPVLQQNYNKKCNTSYISAYGFVDGIPIYIDDIKDNMQLKCLKGHDLIKASDSEYFVHKNATDVDGLKLSDYHNKWTAYFPYTEIDYPKKCNKQIYNRISDITLENTDLIVEIQNSPIHPDEVQSRILDYKLHNKNIIWVINCKGCTLETKSETEHIVHFKTNGWQYNSFLGYNYVFWDFNDKIARIIPNDINENGIIIDKLFTKKEFTKSLHKNKNLWEDGPYIIDGQFYKNTEKKVLKWKKIYREKSKIVQPKSEPKSKLKEVLDLSLLTEPYIEESIITYLPIENIEQQCVINQPLEESNITHQFIEEVSLTKSPVQYNSKRRYREKAEIISINCSDYTSGPNEPRFYSFTKNKYLS